MRYTLIHRRVIALDGAPLAKIESHVSLRKPQPPQDFNIDSFAALLVRLLNEAEGLVATEEQGSASAPRSAPSSPLRNETIEECAAIAETCTVEDIWWRRDIAKAIRSLSTPLLSGEGNNSISEGGNAPSPDATSGSAQ